MPTTKAQTKRDQFIDLLQEYILQEVSYTLADGAQATEAKKHFDFKRRKAHKAILEFVFPAKEDASAETAGQQPPDNVLIPTLFRKRTMNSTTGLKELKLARETFNLLGSVYSSQKDFKNAHLCFDKSNQMEHGIAALEILIHQHGNYKFAFEQWDEKTQWVQDTSESHELGKHRADVLKDRIDSLTQQLKTRECKCKHVPFNAWFTEELAKKASKGTNT